MDSTIRIYTASASRWGRHSLVLILLFAMPAGYADVLEDILEREAIRFGVAEFAPWTMQTEDGALSGFEIDMARKIASDMGVSPIFKVYAWDNLVGALQRGEIDVIAAGMGITAKRALEVNFSRPVGVGGISIATNTARTESIESLNELNHESVRITAVKDTLAEDVANMFFAEANIQIYPDGKTAEAELIEGRAHAYLATVPEVNFLSIRHPDGIDSPLSEPLLASSEALAVRKGEQQLLNFLNAWVTARQTDKWLETTRTFWFETMNWAGAGNR